MKEFNRVRQEKYCLGDEMSLTKGLLLVII